MKVVVGGRNGVRTTRLVRRKYEDVSLSDIVRVLGRDACDYIKVILLDISSDKVGKLNLQIGCARVSGYVVAPL